jgi:hypothetical protein
MIYLEFRTYPSFGRFFVIQQLVKTPKHMKKLIYSLAIVIMLGISANTVQAAGITGKNKTELTAEQQVQFTKITERVEEIRNMDKSDMSRTEKKELRDEWRCLSFSWSDHHYYSDLAFDLVSIFKNEKPRCLRNIGAFVFC